MSSPSGPVPPSDRVPPSDPVPQPTLETDPGAFPERVDVAIIGAGPAGTAAAAILHRAGRSVCVVEALRFPRFVIGESLLARCMDVLDEAGLLDAVRDRGYLVKRGALFLRGEAMADIDFSEQFTPGWTWTWQVPRADFDLTLANTAVRMGVPLFYDHAVTGIELGNPVQGESLLTVRGPGGQRTLRARQVIDASGYGRVLPGLLGLERPSTLPPRRALFTHVRGDRRPPGAQENRIWIVMHPGGAWIWIIPFADGVTSVGVVADPPFFEQFPGTDEEVLRAVLAGDPHSAGRLRDATFLWAPRNLRGYSAAVSRLWGPGYVLVGNATEFLDPVFSSGVTLALESAMQAAKLVDRALGGEAVDWETEYTAYMSRGIETFRAFVEGWYTGDFPRILFAPNPSPMVRRQITSVLAGYVWDDNNPFVRTPARRVQQVLNLIDRAERASPPAPHAPADSPGSS